MIYIIDHQDSFTWNVVHQFSKFDKVYCSNYFEINQKKIALEKLDRLIFVVNEGKMGLAIGKGGSHIKTLQNKINRNVELVEYSDNQERFLKNILNEKYINEIKISKRLDDTFQAVITVDPAKKGVVVGREGRNAEKARLLARRYFQITSIVINSQQTSLEW